MVTGKAQATIEANVLPDYLRTESRKRSGGGLME